MTALRTVQFCARCNELETLHEIRRNGSRGKRYGTGNGNTLLPVACQGFEPGRVEERLPEEELRRRLAEADRRLTLVIDEHIAATPSGECVGCGCPSPCYTLRAARGEL